MSDHKRSPRGEEEYVLDTGLRLLKVLEALEGTNFEPATIKRVEERTKFPYDFCRRALLTLKRAGFATQNERGLWAVGPKLLLFSDRFNVLCTEAMKGQP